MSRIVIEAPEYNGYAYGSICLRDMDAHRELCRAAHGETVVIPTDRVIDLGVAWGWGKTPPVLFRFMALPGWRYRLMWVSRGFGKNEICCIPAGFGEDEQGSAG